MEGDTASLRKAAPHWSLAGDKQLLGMLQTIHQKIMTKCEEANVKLDAMVDALDNASIDLQNVNNKFMALSNSQFVESRVYDDDVDISSGENTEKAGPPKVEAESEIMRLKHSLQLLEKMHEPVHILDSDSSDDEDDGRLVLKPKDVYSHRPLPYIIGSQAWKSKWHAGLVQEDSDSDSSVSKRENVPAEEYSDSEPETAPTTNTDKLAQRTISSSSMESEVTPHSQAASQVARQPAKPADIAAELARRLGGQPVHLPAVEPVAISTPPEPTTTKVYRVEKPAPTTVFSDEPPPLDDYQSYKSDHTEDDDDDIFAELHKKPYPAANKDKGRVVKDLFGGLNDNIVDDLFGEVDKRDTDIGNVVDYQNTKPYTTVIKTSPLLENMQKSDSVTDKSETKVKLGSESKIESESVVKKPVGGISLFGSNKGAESIGAAILKRNQRKTSSSDEETSIPTENKEKVPSSTKIKTEPVNKIIEDLFSKSAKIVTQKEESEKLKPGNDKIDIFSDNIFDDIDDIFTTNIVTKPKDNNNQKSIFDDDDLFADITINKSDINSKNDTKNIFDSNDDLFSENVKSLKTEVDLSSNSPRNVTIVEENATVNVEPEKIKANKIITKIFDSDTEDDQFSDPKVVNDIVQSQSRNIETVKEINNDENSPNIKTEGDNLDKLFLNKTLVNQNVKSDTLNTISYKSQFESPSLFEDDEFDDLLSTKSNNKKENKEFLESFEVNKSTHAEATQSNLEINTEFENEVRRSLDDISTKSKLQPVFTKSIDNFVDDKEKHVETLVVSNQDRIDNVTDRENSRVINLLEEKDSKKFKNVSELLHEDGDKIPSPTSLIPQAATLESSQSDIFNDIFTNLPPSFEKPLEPKKSKNVNALFDDDSDDEVSFFKKNEGISDEKPDLNYSGDRFRIFHDEPPEIDVDFSQKAVKNTSCLFSDEPDDELFVSSPNHYNQNTRDNILSDDTEKLNELHENINVGYENKTTNAVDITKLIENAKESDKISEINVSKLIEKSETNHLIDTTPQDKSVLTTKPGSTDISDVRDENETDKFAQKKIIEEAESEKYIGKLKPINININVNTLLPGASLKKSKANEETDGLTISTQSNEELNLLKTEKIETKMVKSISFDGDPESEILDNKLSKQRAKIQVKRRPSSRRARLEAVRKSGIEIASDSTDNSSSFDEPPGKDVAQRKVSLEKVNSNTITQDFINNDTYKENTLKDTPQTNNTSKATNTKKNSTEVKSKLVYILNDEDIFTDVNTNTTTMQTNYSEIEKGKSTIGDDDPLFESSNISILGKTYKNKSGTTSNNSRTEIKTSTADESVQIKSNIAKEIPSKTNKSFFDDLSEDEDELFGSKKPEGEKSTLFDSDSEGELLFNTSKRGKKSAAEVTKEKVKQSLFGDESDDDNDLFAVKERKPTGSKIQTNTSKESAAKTAEPVFEDPLSMFHEHDDS